MANVNCSLLFLVLCIIFCIFASIVEPAAALGNRQRQQNSRSRSFVEKQCRATLYQDLCVRSLANFVNPTTQTPQQLAQLALRVSLTRARYARVYMIQVAKELKQSKAKEYQAVKDCLEQINDGVDQLTRSVTELQRINEQGESKFVWRQSNVETWTSAALTDALSCMDGFSVHSMGGKKKAIIRAKVLNVAQVTSNALALFSRFAARHRASHVRTP